MEQAVEAFTLMLVIANGIFSYRGFTSRRFFDKNIFWVQKISSNGEYIRLLTSGFLHANWGHLIFNMFALYSFSIGVGAVFGFIKYITIYFSSLIAGNLLALFIHRREPDYRAVGASGAVCGVIFSSILLFPGSSITFLFLPIAVPAWLFGFGFVLISIYGIRSRLGNIGHEAHLGGAITGVAVSIIFNPSLLAIRWILVLSILIPVVTFLVLVIYYPEIIKLRGTSYTRRRTENSKDKRKMIEELQSEIDSLLDKIDRDGYGNLSDAEKTRLDRLSAEIERLR